MTRVSSHLCILFLDEFRPEDAGRYQVTLRGGSIQTLPILVEGVASKKDKMENGFLVETALNSDISISAMGRLDGGCKFLFTSKDDQRTCCFHGRGQGSSLDLCHRHHPSCKNATKVTVDTRRSQCTLSLTNVTEADSGTYLASFPAEYSHKTFQGYKDKKVEVEVSCETHGLECNTAAPEFLDSFTKYLVKCKWCVSFTITCTGTG